MSLSRFNRALAICSIASLTLLAGCASTGASDNNKIVSLKSATGLTDGGRYVLSGDISPDSARINLCTRSTGTHSVAVLEGGNESKARLYDIETWDLGGTHYSRGNLDLHGLKPKTRYVVVGAEGPLGEFTTLCEDPEVVRLMIGSCLNYKYDTSNIFPDFNVDANRYEVPNHEVWKVMNDQSFDAAFLIGDRFYLPNGYEDYDDMTDADFFQMIDEHHEGMMQIPGVTEFLTRTPVYVTWDDHDFGPNNSAGDFRFKDAAWSHTAWSLPQPSMGTESTKGIFFKQEFGDVDVYVLDGRYYRECSNRIEDNYRTGEPAHYCGVDGIEQPNREFVPDEMLTDLYGQDQLNWLKDELKASDAPVKLVIGGNQFLSNISKWEAWYHYSEREEFLNWMNENPVPGVVFVSGDRHHGEVGVLDQNVPYPLYELTSSGMGTNCYLSDEIGDPDPSRSPFDVLGGTSQNHFGVIEYHAAKNEIILQLQNYEGEVVTHEVIDVAKLTP